VRVSRVFGDSLVSAEERSHDRSRAVLGPENRARDGLKSAGVGLLLLSVVVSAIAGVEAALFFTVLAAWLLFPVLVGLRNALDAGCTFMLIALAVVVVVGVAQNGLGYLLP
jgi:lysylphosphatidylglycerol synthetase-like protein (DUF2156 family)